MKKAALAFVVLVLAAGSARAAWFSSCDEDAYRSATLDLLIQQHLYPTDLSTCDWLDHCSADQVQDARQRAKDIRAFAQTMTDVCAKSQIEDWASFVDYQANRGEDEMRTHKTRDEHAEVGDKQKAVDHRAADILRKLQQ